MRCKICNNISLDVLCNNCSDSFIYDKDISAFRLNKHKLVHEHRRESRLRKLLKGMFGAAQIYEEVCFEWCYNPETGCLLRFDFLVVDGGRIFLIEFNGEQHYKRVNFFHKTKLDFEKQKLRDKIKVETCRKMKMPLIIVPFNVAINEQNIKRLIITNLKK